MLSFHFKNLPFPDGFQLFVNGLVETFDLDKVVFFIEAPTPPVSLRFLDLSRFFPSHECL